MSITLQGRSVGSCGKTTCSILLPREAMIERTGDIEIFRKIVERTRLGRDVPDIHRVPTL